MNKTAKFATGASNRAHHCLSLKQLNWLELSQLLLTTQLSKAHKLYYLTNKIPILQDLIQPYTTTRALRSTDQNHINVIKHRNEAGKSLFACSIAKVWNSLPKHITSTGSAPQFKKLLKTHYFNNWLCPCDSPG